MSDSRASTQDGRYYTSPEKAGPLHDDFRLLWGHVYTLMDRVKDMHSQIHKDDHKANGNGGAKKAPQAEGEDAGSPSHTKIAGLYVQPKPPSQGTSVANLSQIPVLGYNPKTGQIEWFIPT